MSRPALDALEGLLNGFGNMLKDICSKYSRVKPKLVIRGDYTDENDINILVVSNELSRDPRQAFEVLFDPENPKIVPVGMITEVFLSKLAEGDPFILEVLEDGKLLCADMEFYDYVMRLFREVRANYVRRGRTWIKVSRRTHQESSSERRV